MLLKIELNNRAQCNNAIEFPLSVIFTLHTYYILHTTYILATNYYILHTTYILPHSLLNMCNVQLVTHSPVLCLLNIVLKIHMLYSGIPQRPEVSIYKRNFHGVQISRNHHHHQLKRFLTSFFPGDQQVWFHVLPSFIVSLSHCMLAVYHC